MIKRNLYATYLLVLHLPFTFDFYLALFLILQIQWKIDSAECRPNGYIINSILSALSTATSWA
jgi:hypothetical protein